MRPNIKAALDRYGKDHSPVGHFLTAVLENDLCQAVFRADDYNIQDILEIVRYVYNDLPGTCWGSPAAVKAWLKNEEGR